MKSLLAFLIAINHFQTVLADQITNSDDEIILSASLPQKIVSRYETNFSQTISSAVFTYLQRLARSGFIP